METPHLSVFFPFGLVASFSIQFSKVEIRSWRSYWAFPWARPAATGGCCARCWWWCWASWQRSMESCPWATWVWHFWWWPSWLNSSLVKSPDWWECSWAAKDSSVDGSWHGGYTTHFGDDDNPESMGDVGIPIKQAVFHEMGQWHFFMALLLEMRWIHCCINGITPLKRWDMIWGPAKLWLHIHLVHLSCTSNYSCPIWQLWIGCRLQLMRVGLFLRCVTFYCHAPLVILYVCW